MLDLLKHTIVKTFGNIDIGFSKQNFNKYMKKYLTFMVIREMQTEAKLRFHLTPERTAISEKSKREPLSLLSGMETGMTIMKITMEIAQRTETGNSVSCGFAL